MADIGVFPALPGLAWSVTKAPTFQTRIQRAVSGRELRALDYPFPLWQFSLIFDFLRDDQTAGVNELRTLAGFYLACQGAYSTFLYDDPTDNSAAGQVIGAGDSSQTVFQLARSFGGAPGFIEPILAPNTVRAIYLNGLLQNPSGYSVDPTSGILTFLTAPTTGATITSDFSYYFRCRFVEDSYTFENFMTKLWTVKKMTFISVRP